ncbi:MAG TPA: MMPL family transporter [Actinomycetota bacterium]|nr:MMPL family transporter [Actinomycetota bacterium]
MRINPESLAKASSRHPWRVVTIWVVFLAAGIASAATLLGPALTTDFDFTNVPEAKRAMQILEDQNLSEDVISETFVVAGEPGAIEDPAFVEQVNGFITELDGLGPDVFASLPTVFPLTEEQAADPQVAALGPIPSEDGSAVLFTGVYAGDIDEATPHFEDVEAAREAVSTEGVEAHVLGAVSSSEDFRVISEEDLAFGEGIGVTAAIIVLLIVFGAIVAGLLPLLKTVLFTLPITLGIVGLLGTLWDFSFFTPNLITMMGIAVGVDYALFIVSRYREERHRDRVKLDAIRASGATASRAVFFSGMTVVIALAGIMVVPTTIFRSLAGGAIIVVLVSVASSMTLLPAVLALLGDRVNWPYLSRVPTLLVFVSMLVGGAVVGGALAGAGASVVAPIGGLVGFIGVGIIVNRLIKRGAFARYSRPEGSSLSSEGGFWDRVTRAVMGRPVAWLTVGGAFMVALSLPYWFQGHPDGEGSGIKTGFAGISTLPEGIQTKEAYDVIVERFPKAGAQATVEVVIEADGLGTPGAEPGAPGELTGEVAAAMGSLESAIAEDPTLGTPAPPLVSQDGSVAMVEIPLAGAATDPASEAAVATVASLRETYVPQAFADSDATVLVGGETAFVKDFFDISDTYTPLIILVVLGLSFLLLTVVFRSLVVPAKAIVMNLLSVGAAYGLIVLVFQKGGPAIGESIANLFGFVQVDAIEAWLPLFLFSILFGLSMDYHVFLLSRIREQYDKTGDNAASVAYGLRTTGGIITGAAIIMVAVFAGFAAGRLTSLEQMGFGLAVAVFLDATVVRSILVPSTMRLLGDRNWYLPRWLQWLPKIDVEGHDVSSETILVPDTPGELVEAESRD